MKAILIIDMPTNCNECRILNYEYGCPIIGATGERNKGRSEMCPLKPMPQKYCTDGDDIEEDSYWQGWNECLKEIEK